MADPSVDLVGIRAPNPFRLASAAPTDKACAATARRAARISP